MAAASGGLPVGRRQAMAVRSGALLDAVAPQVNAVTAENCTAAEVKDRSRPRHLAPRLRDRCRIAYRPRLSAGSTQTGRAAPLPAPRPRRGGSRKTCPPARRENASLAAGGLGEIPTPSENKGNLFPLIQPHARDDDGSFPDSAPALSLI